MALLRLVRVGLVVAVSLAGLVAFWAPTAATTTPHIEDATPSTIHEMRATSADIDRRVDPGHKVLTVRPNFYAYSEREMAYTSRMWIMVSPYSGGKLNYDEVPRYDDIRNGVARMLRTGQIQVVVMTPRTGYLIRYWDRAYDVFREHFCRVDPRPNLYDRFGVDLYEWHADPPADCTSRINIQWSG